MNVPREAGRVLPIALIALLAPLPWIGDLRDSLAPYLVLTVAATLLLYAGSRWFDRRHATLSSRMILLVALLLRVVMLPMMPSLSDDAYRYVWDGRLVLNGFNPYHYVPSDSALSDFHDELYRLQGYPNTNTIYPPGAQLLFAVSVAVAKPFHGVFTPPFIAWKLLDVGAELIAIWLLLRLLIIAGIPTRNAILYAWHPLAVVEIAGQGHTDAFWVLAIVLFLYLYVRNRAGGGAPAVAFGASVRLFPVTLLPLWARFTPWRRLLPGMLLSIPFALLFIPLLEPRSLETFTSVLGKFTTYFEFNGGFYYAVKWALDALHIQPSNAIAGSIGIVVQVLLLAAVWLWPIREWNLRTLAVRCLLAVSIPIVFASKVHIWYFLAPLCLVPLLQEYWLERAWRWAALIGPFTYLMYASTPPHESTWVLVLEWGTFAALSISGYVGTRRTAER